MDVFFASTLCESRVTFGRSFYEGYGGSFGNFMLRWVFLPTGNRSMIKQILSQRAAKIFIHLDI